LRDASWIDYTELVLGKTYAGENCSAARALELVGERWSLLIVRDALFRGITRFREFQRSLAVASNVLASRLDGFVSAGIMETRPSSDGSDHREYVLTEKGTALQPVIVALTAWGDCWAAPSGPPIVFKHLCGGNIEQKLSCTSCGAHVRKPSEVEARPKAQGGSRKRATGAGSGR
jgi:DNA-binding HxlR family transcriptional regulator